MQIGEQLEVFLRLLGQLLAEFGNMKEERCQKVLKDAKNLLDAAVDEYRPNEGLKDVAHDLAWLKDLDLSIVHPEVLLEGVADVAVQVILLVQLLLVLPTLLVLLHVTGSRSGLTAGAIVTVVARLSLFIEDVLLDAKEGNQLRQEVILCQQAFGLVGIERLEVLLGDVGLVLALLYVVFFEHSVLDEIRVGDVVENGVAEDLHLLVARGKPVCLLEAAMGQGLKEQILIRELEIEDLLYRRADQVSELRSHSHLIELFEVLGLTEAYNSLGEQGRLLVQLQHAGEEPVAVLVRDLKRIWQLSLR